MTAVLPEASSSHSLDARLDRLSAQVDAIADELRLQREAREMWGELAGDLTPVARGAMDLATRELGDLSDEVTLEDAARLARTAARSLPQLEAALAQLGPVSDLVAEATPLAAPAMASLTDALAEAERKGYFTFARGGLAIADRVVTSFGEDDVAALGDNIVLMLTTLKEMTQPEVMTLLQRTAVTAQHLDEPAAPPSTLALLRQLRDPEVRRGLNRLLTVLRTLGENPTTPTLEGQP